MRLALGRQCDWNFRCLQVIFSQLLSDFFKTTYAVIKWLIMSQFADEETHCDGFGKYKYSPTLAAAHSPKLLSVSDWTIWGSPGSLLCSPLFHINDDIDGCDSCLFSSREDLLVGYCVWLDLQFWSFSLTTLLDYIQRCENIYKNLSICRLLGSPDWVHTKSPPPHLHLSPPFPPLLRGPSPSPSLPPTNYKDPLYLLQLAARFNRRANLSCLPLPNQTRLALMEILSRSAHCTSSDGTDVSQCILHLQHFTVLIVCCITKLVQCLQFPCRD